VLRKGLSPDTENDSCPIVSERVHVTFSNSRLSSPGLQEWRTIIACFGDCSIIMIIYSHNDETMTDAYECVDNKLVFSFGQP